MPPCVKCFLWTYGELDLFEPAPLCTVGRWDDVINHYAKKQGYERNRVWDSRVIEVKLALGPTFRRNESA